MPEKEQWDRAKALMAEGHGPSYVARETGISRQLLWSRFTEQGRAARAKRRVANLSPEQIERTRASKRRYAEAIRVGKRLDLPPSEVYQMLKQQKG
jgi:hypothetical protein